MKTLIIDGANLIWRTWWTAKNANNTGEGIAGLHIWFTLKAVHSYVKQFKPDQTFVTWDDRTEGSNIRKDEHADYKQNRTGNPEPHEQTKEIREFLNCLGIQSLMPRNLEGDDIVSYLTDKFEGRKIIVSVDKDFLQLVNNNVSIYNPIKWDIIDTSNFEEYAKASNPKEFLFIKAVGGDKSDNIQGIPGFGPAKIKKLLNGSVQLTEDQQQIVDKNMELFRLDRYKDVEGEKEYYDNQIQEKPTQNKDRFFDLCKMYNINSIINNRSEWVTTYFTKQLLRNLFD